MSASGAAAVGPLCSPKPVGRLLGESRRSMAPERGKVVDLRRSAFGDRSRIAAVEFIIDAIRHRVNVGDYLDGSGQRTTAPGRNAQLDECMMRIAVPLRSVSARKQ
jgi:hypothetical protein